MVDEILDAGWKFNFVRMHLDPYWSDDPSMTSVRYEGHERFSEVRFRKYLDELFVPMAEYFISKGMYVVMRPPGVCPNGDGYEGIELGDTYQTFLLKVWDIVSSHVKLKNNTGLMFELANEPVNIKGTDGKFGSSGDACFANMKEYFQAIVDKIRSNNNNIIWVPGLAYQSSYAGYATHRIEGENIGFAVQILDLQYIVTPDGMAVMQKKTALKVLVLLQEEVMKLFSVDGMHRLVLLQNLPLLWLLK